ncbi:MAG: Gfo/Idh/MocA family oxidoreductase [Chthonomonadales bacterium]|nr:Gfo/Idh/MocA family oxidoreductase [Chthonomonadales bacterium]
MNRRQFLGATAASAALAVVPGIARARKQSTNDKLNIGLIGVWGRGLAFYDTLDHENVVALCDVNEARFADALKRFPNARTYIDWRKCLDHKGLDAVIICTPDHHHAFIANWALNRDLHVYCEKPLAISVEEARIVRANWLKKRGKLATQVGMQRHAYPNFNRVRELIRNGAIGELQSACAWGDRQIRRPGYPPAEGEPPAGLHWDLWLGPSPEHPYSPSYFAGGPGMNCLSWNMYWDFGAGQIGDMGSHTMDLLWNAVDAHLPTSAEARGEPFNPDVTPVTCESHFEHPANAWRGPIRVSWYQGGAMPESPSKWVDLRRIDHGAMFEGTRGYVIADFTARMLIPMGDKADMTYYKPPKPEETLPNLGDFVGQWIRACKDPTIKTACDFDYSGEMIEQLLLGLVAYRVGKKITYDPVTGRVTDVPEANRWLARTYRSGWTLNG